MQYKLVLNEDNPELTYIKLLTTPYTNMLILMGSIQLKNDEFGIVKEIPEIVDFSYKIVEGDELNEMETEILTIHISEILCDLLNATMLEPPLLVFSREFQ